MSELIRSSYNVLSSENLFKIESVEGWTDSENWNKIEPIRWPTQYEKWA